MPPPTLSRSLVLAKLFFGFAAASRIEILAELTHGEQRVKDLAEFSGLTRPNTSHQLGQLWDAGLVARRRVGNETHYRLVEGVSEMLSLAETTLENAQQTPGACPRPPGSGALRRPASSTPAQREISSQHDAAQAS